MINRFLADKIRYMVTKFPVVMLTGVRQCGKSTLLRNCFKDYKYISLEDIDLRNMATDDPRGFLNNFGTRIIIDEAQYAPQLFSYIQTQTDEINETGMYILSGSQNFLLMENVSQSLAGRAAILKLTPFSIRELINKDIAPKTLNEWLFTGGYPRIYDKNIPPADYFPSYIQTYIERDVRLLRNVSDLTLFMRFLRLCAARIGQLINLTSLANECDITVPTAQAWLSILETSYLVFLLKPYHNNFNKRLIKSPKLYFYDTGLAAALLGMTQTEQIETHYLRGELFENEMIAECIKMHYEQGKEPQMFFWRDSNQNEVDLLVENGVSLQAFEIKSSATINPKFFKGLKTFQKISNIPTEAMHVIYGGDINYQSNDGRFISWKNWNL